MRTEQFDLPPDRKQGYKGSLFPSPSPRTMSVPEGPAGKDAVIIPHRLHLSPAAFCSVWRNAPVCRKCTRGGKDVLDPIREGPGERGLSRPFLQPSGRRLCPSTVRTVPASAHCLLQIESLPELFLPASYFVGQRTLKKQKQNKTKKRTSTECGKGGLGSFHENVESCLRARELPGLIRTVSEPRTQRAHCQVIFLPSQ